MDCGEKIIRAGIARFDVGHKTEMHTRFPKPSHISYCAACPILSLIYLVKCSCLFKYQMNAYSSLCIREKGKKNCPVIFFSEFYGIEIKMDGEWSLKACIDLWPRRAMRGLMTGELWLLKADRPERFTKCFPTTPWWITRLEMDKQKAECEIERSWHLDFGWWIIHLSSASLVINHPKIIIYPLARRRENKKIDLIPNANQMRFSSRKRVHVQQEIINCWYRGKKKWDGASLAGASIFYPPLHVGTRARNSFFLSLSLYILYLFTTQSKFYICQRCKLFPC